MNICETCCKEHDGSYGSGRFCSIKCSRSFATKDKRAEINKAVSKTLSKGYIELVCIYCKNSYKVKYNKRNQQYCSRLCSRKDHGWSNHNTVDWSTINRLSYANGNNYVAGGTSKWYNYKNIKVQGSYELRACKILDKWKESNIIKDWEYTNDRLQYIGEDYKQHSYLLDFKVIENDNSFYYLETKGYTTSNDLLKWEAVRNQGFNLKIWFDKEIKENEK
jgi:hypothetical protein